MPTVPVPRPAAPVTVTVVPADAAGAVRTFKAMTLAQAEKVLKEQRDMELEEAGFFRRPFASAGWTLVLALLAKLIPYVIDIFLDQLSQLGPDQQMALLVQRKKEVAALKGPRPF